MLNSNLKYVAFDFETTGLNPKTDEAIQIGIVQFDHNFKITKKFSSYIRPNNMSALSEIVSFTTGIEISQLEKAPSFKEIQKDILEFFDEKTIILGHNIQFDINFLEKYVGKFPYADKFDTYTFARKYMFFEPSYALEILADKYGFKLQSHDAFEDAIMSMELFKIIIKKINKAIGKYPFLADILLKSDSLLTKILELKKINRNVFSIPKKGITIPKQKKISSNMPKLDEYENKTTFNTIGTNIKDIFNFVVNGQNKLILSFSSNARLNVIRNFLKEKYISFSMINNGYTISSENETKLLEKKKLESYESEYILKLFIQYLEDVSIQDIANFDEYKVYKFLADKKRAISSNLVLSTHYDLFNFIKTNGSKEIKNHKIIFFDWNYWTNNLSRTVNKGFDFYELIKELEVLEYSESYENKNNYTKLLNEISTFFGTLSIQLQPLFKGTNNKIEMVNLIEDTRLQSFKDVFYQLTNKISTIPDKNITSMWETFNDCINHYCIIEQKLFSSGQLKYIFYPLMKNIDINTFNDFMKDLTHYNFTVLENKNYVKLSEILNITKKDNNKFIDWNENIDFKLLVEKVKNSIEKNESLFLVSNNKNFSNSLFKLIFNLLQEYNLDTNIYAENITGGQGKLLYYLSKTKGSKITIGGPEFLIQNKAKGIYYDKIHLLALGGKNRKTIIKELQIYI